MGSSTHERMDPVNFIRVAPDVRLGRNVVLHAFVNLYGCQIGDETRIGTFVEIQKNAIIGARCKIQSHTFICEGVTIEDEVFVGHGVIFINDPDPRATMEGTLQTDADWQVVPTRVCRGASIGSGSVILSGVTIGAGALVGAGAVVTRDVAPGMVVVGVPRGCFAGAGNQESSAMLMITTNNPGSAAAPKELPVPFLDLRAQFAKLRDEVLEALEDVAESTSYVLGPRVAQFEEAFAAYLEARYCVGVNSGTSALHLALICAGSNGTTRSSRSR